MAATAAVKKLFSLMKVLMFFKTPGVAVADMGGWIDMRDYSNFSVSAMEAVLVGLGITQFEIRAAVNSDGTGGNAVIVSHALGTAPDAVGDTVVLECSAEQIKEVGVAAGVLYRYVSAWVKCANAGDKIALTYIAATPRFPADLLTADVIS